MDINELLKVSKHQIISFKELSAYLQEKPTTHLTLKSGSTNFDELLGGGFCRGRKYLIFGSNRTGKTQLAHQLCVQNFVNYSPMEAIRNNKLNYVYFLDTENTFRPGRLRELALKYGGDKIEIFENIFVSKIMSNSAFLFSLKDLENQIEKSNGGVLIIDSINNHYNSELADKLNSSNIVKQRFIKILEQISRLTIKYNLITIALAQVTSNLGQKSIIPVSPVGNHILNHFFSEYIYLEYINENQRYFHLVNSVDLPEKRLPFIITSAGIQDSKI